MKATLALVAALLLFGCDTPQPAEDRGEVAQGPSPAAIAQNDGMGIVGEYRIAGVGGRDVDQPYAITAAISADRIHVTADCLNFAWRYTTRADRIAAERVPVEGCGRGLTGAEEAVVAAFDGAKSVTRTPANALEFSGDGEAITLFSQ